MSERPVYGGSDYQIPRYLNLGWIEIDPEHSTPERPAYVYTEKHRVAMEEFKRKYERNQKIKRWVSRYALAIVLGVPVIYFLYEASQPSTTPNTGAVHAGILAQEGQEVTIALESNNVYVPCGSTPEALSEMMKWGSANDWDEVKRTGIKTDSTLLYNGDHVKVLDRGLLRSKVRVLQSDKECWVVSEILRR